MNTSAAREAARQSNGEFGPQVRSEPDPAKAGLDTEPTGMTLEELEAAGRCWKEGRRIYVRCGYRSQANTEMRDIGAKWDRDAGALWVGSGKAPLVVQILNDAATRAEQVEGQKGLGLWVKIPYEDASAREEAKRLGAKWDKDRKEWAMPDQESLDKIETRVAAATAPKPQPHRNQPEPARIDWAGWKRTGEERYVQRRIEGNSRYMRRAEAEQFAPRVGTVRDLKSGGRYMVTSVSIQFLKSEECEDQGFYGVETGWYADIRGEVVEPEAG